MKKTVSTKKQKKIKRIKAMALKVFAYIIGLAIVITMAFFCVKFFGLRTVIIDQSMSPVLQKEDVVFVNSISYKIGSPKRMDVVSLKIGSADSSPTYVRRIIGIPGDTVKISGGKLYVNDEEVEITYNDEAIENAGVAEEGITLDEDEYFVMCDNYNNSRDDSRLDSIGTISSEKITGKVWFRRSPLSRIGFIK